MSYRFSVAAARGEFLRQPISSRYMLATCGARLPRRADFLLSVGTRTGPSFTS